MALTNVGITISVSGTVGAARVSQSSSRTNYVSGNASLVNDQVLSTVAESLDVPDDMSSVGVVLLVNNDAAIDILAGGTTDFPILIRKGGGVASFEVAEGFTLKLKSASGTPSLDVFAVERGTTTTTTTTAAPTTTTTTTT